MAARTADSRGSPGGLIRPGRRQFLAAGLGGSLALAVATWSRPLPARPRDPWLLLRPGDVFMFERLAPHLIGPAFPDNDAARHALLREIDHYLAHLPAQAQLEVRQLFDLLQNGLTRIPLTGLWANWRFALDSDIADFLDDWRHSRFALLRASYRALRDATTTAWYGLPQSWALTGYPGPPEALLRGARELG